MSGPTIVIGTAGHIDHGKTSLLRALTGIDADRLPEEQARGMTIDVGYAHLAFDDGVELDFVDVPGHDRLIGNMLVGAGEIDAAMLVVAADDGPRPQTLEHLQLLDALGIEDRIAIVTKIDAVEAERAEAVVSEVRALLGGTTLASVPVLAVSSITGEGVAAMRAALRDVRDAVAARMASGAAGGGPAWLSVDRAFAVKGRGAVVTGTLRGGPIERGSTLRREPGGEAVRVREVQVHGAARDRHDGGRTALNLAGLSADELRRGDVLTSDPGVQATSRLLVDARSGPLPKAGAAMRLHIGTDQVDATVRRTRGDAGVFLLNLARETATFVGARAVLREPASGRVVTGVQVLDTHPPRGASRRRQTPERVAALREAVIGGGAGIEGALIDLHGARVVDDGAADHGVARTLTLARDVRTVLDAAALEAVAAHHRESPVSPGLPLPRARAAVLRRLRSLATVERRDLDLVSVTVARVVNHLVSDGRLLRHDDVLRDPAIAGDEPVELHEAMARLERALDVPAPPPLDAAAAASGCPPEGVQALQSAGRIVRLAPELAWSAAAYHRLAAVALELGRREPLTPAALRDATGTSRKYVLAILEDLDRRQVLRRTPEGHIPGPRAPQPSPSATSTKTVGSTPP